MSILESLASACSGLNYDATNQLDLITSFLSIVNGSTFSQWESYYNRLENTGSFVQKLSLAGWQILYDTYPFHWKTMWAFAIVTLVKLVHLLAKVLKDREFIDEETTMWNHFFKLALKLQSMKSQQENPKKLE